MVEKFFMMLERFLMKWLKEYDKFRVKQDRLYNSDFDKFILEVSNMENK